MRVAADLPKIAIERTLLLWTCIALGAALGVRPQTDRLTWFLENVPILVALPILAATRRSFPLTPLLYRLLWLHALILMVGGHYSYAHVPLGDWARDAFHLARNHYDRLGHFAQGFIPAILIREYLRRRSPLKPGMQLAILVVACCLSFSAFYELFEWGTAVLTAEGATEFLGTQGDPWDSQWDMFLATLGAIASLTLLGRRHERALAGLVEPPRG